MKNLMLALAALGTAGMAHASLIQTQIDLTPNSTGVVDNGTINPGEYATNFSNGSGAGFGGTLGGGTIHMDADANNLYFGFTGGNALNDIVVVYLDTKAGGFDDSTMSDTSDGGRTAVTELAINAIDQFPVGFGADYAVIFGNGFALSFELTSGSLIYQGNADNANEVTASRSMLGLGSGNIGFNWFAAYCSGSGFNSNESMPGSNLGSDNPGFDRGSNYENYNRFEAVPEPATMTALALGAAAMLRRRRK